MSNDKMAKTPENNKNKSFNTTLTPVRCVRSPSQDSNVIIVKNRLETITKSLQDNFKKWQLAQERGLALCTAIEAIKTRCLEENSDTHYPDDLEKYCDKLAVVATIFDDIMKNTRKMLRQLRELGKLPGSCDEIFYRTWKLEQFITFIEEVLSRYEEENKVKQDVMREIPHGTTRSELIAYATAWEYPQYVDDFIVFQFKILEEELAIV